MIKNNILNFVVFFIMGLSVGFAQTSKKLEVRILTFDRVDDIRKMNLLNGEKVLEVGLHKNNFTGPYELSTRELRFFKVGKDLSEPENLTPDASVTIPLEMGNKVLLVAIPNREKYVFIPMKEGYDDFKNGEITMINLTNLSVGASLNDKDTLIPAGGAHVWRDISKQKVAHEYPAKFYHTKNKKYQLFSSGYWEFRPDVRKYCFIYYKNTETKRIKISSISDYAPAVESADN